MSIELTTKVLSIQDLPQSAKFLLTILCFRANQNNEVYSSIERLCLDCSCSKNTIETNLKLLRDKDYLLYTGKHTGESHRIPIYCINLNHPNKLGDKELITPNLGLDHPKIQDKITPNFGVQKDNINKDNRKDIVSFLTPEQIKRYKKEKELQMIKLK